MKRRCEDAVWDRVQRVVANGLDLQSKDVTNGLVLSEFFGDDFDVEELALELSDEFEDDGGVILPDDIYNVMQGCGINNGTVGQLADRIQEILDDDSTD